MLLRIHCVPTCYTLDPNFPFSILWKLATTKHAIWDTSISIPFYPPCHIETNSVFERKWNKIKMNDLCCTNVSIFVIIITIVYINNIYSNIFHTYLNTYLQNFLDDKNNTIIYSQISCAPNQPRLLAVLWRSPLVCF